jgi:putative aldouronate transport system substrate-binding protein
MKTNQFLLFLAAAALAAAGGCQSANQEKTGSDEPFPITILTTSFSTSPASKESKVWKMLEEYTHTNLNIIWAPNASYIDKMNISLASGTLPMVIKVENTHVPSVAGAIQKGQIWEIGPYLSRFPNLSKADPEILGNISNEGKVYGIYRARKQGRPGISYRKDWLDKLSLSEPKTIDEFYAVLKAFTKNDPDGNGIDDTYGLAVSKYPLPWDMMQVWFGAPNKWGLDENEKLVPDHYTTEYRNSLKFFRKIYAEGLVNSDFPIYDTTRWNEQLVSGHAGVMLDVADTAGRLETRMKQVNPNAVIDVFGAVEGPYGPRSLSTPGYNGVYLISKSGVKTEQELLKVLDFLDKLNDEPMQRLLYYGLENIHYTMRNGAMESIVSEAVPPEYNANDLTQLLPLIPELTNFKSVSPLREKVNTVIADNEKIIVTNPAEGLESPTYSQKGNMLDDMIAEARVQYITGKIDDKEFDRLLDNWRASGGDKVIQEINDAYRVRKHALNQFKEPVVNK